MREPENKKTTSLRRRLARRYQGRKFWDVLGSDIALLCIAVVSWCYAVENLTLSAWTPKLTRLFTYVPGAPIEALRSMVYQFTEADGTAHAVQAGDFIYPLALCLGILFCIQLLGWCLSWAGEARALRAYLKPIDELALAAERLSSADFDPNKIRRLEDALDRISDPDTRVEVADADLAGLEAAVNNMLKRLEESSHEQMRFVDDASHELRTPIAVIQGYVNMLDRWGKEDPAVLEESIAAIKTEAERMKTLVEQLLFLARGDMGRQRFESLPLPLAPLVRELFEESRMIDPDHVYHLQLDTEPLTTGDAAMLKQAGRILVDNAAKYTPTDGDITLRLYTREGEARLDVQDSGIGIAEGDAAHMFERFYRSDRARSRDGSGLGLSIAQWIIERHGGHIEVLSYESLGTRVTLCVPETAETAGNGTSL